METKNNILTQHRSRIVFPVIRSRAVKVAVRVEDYVLPAKSRKKERVSERIRNILYT